MCGEKIWGLIGLGFDFKQTKTGLWYWCFFGSNLEVFKRKLELWSSSGNGVVYEGCLY